MPGRVLITSRSFLHEVPEAMQVLCDAGLEPVVQIRDVPWAEKDLTRMVVGVEGVVAGLDPFTARVLAAGSRLRIISRNGVGVDAIDVEAASARGIYVTNAGPAVANSVADLTLAMVLSLARQIPQAWAETRAGQWRRRVGFDLAEKILGIIGTGHIGREVAARARAFGMHIVAHDAKPDRAWAAAASVDYLSLTDLLQRADIVSLHVPLTPTTRDLVGWDQFCLMKPSAYLVNTSRGGVVNEQALYRALSAGLLAGAALDVLEEEPPQGSPLLTDPRVLITPHIGSATREATVAACMIAARNVSAVLTGGEPFSAVNLHAVTRRDSGDQSGACD